MRRRVCLWITSEEKGRIVRAIEPRLYNSHNNRFAYYRPPDDSNPRSLLSASLSAHTHTHLRLLLPLTSTIERTIVGVRVLLRSLVSLNRVYIQHFFRVPLESPPDEGGRRCLRQRERCCGAYKLIAFCAVFMKREGCCILEIVYMGFRAFTIMIFLLSSVSVIARV